MKSNRFDILIDFVHKTASTIVPPRIVYEEIVSVYKRNLENNIQITERTISQLKNILVGRADLLNMPYIDVEVNLQEYEKHIQNKFRIVHLEILDYHDSYLFELIRRSINRIKPISKKGEEFRDTVLWLSILDYLKIRTSDESVFISNNINDFANNTGTDFHSDLKTELLNYKIELKYYKCLRDFINERVVQIDFINEEWLLENLDWEILDKSAFEKGGLESIFFEAVYYLQFLEENNLETEDFNTIEIVRASFIKEIPMYFVREMTQKDQYNLELYLDGIGEVKFDMKDGTIFKKELDFYTIVEVEIIDDGITKYSADYYREESGIRLNWENLYATN